MRIMILMCLLFAATLACNLSENERERPTSIPTAVGMSVPTNTSIPAVATSPVNANFPTVTLQPTPGQFPGSSSGAAPIPTWSGNLGSGSSGGSSGVSTSSCPVRWFFNFRSSEIDPLAPCPGQVQVIDAVGQNFQGGRVLWYKTTMAGEPSDTLYVIYNDGTWEQYVDSWTPGQPENDPTIIPPAEWHQPVRGIGKLWREQPGVRDKLGWAYAPEAAFQGRRQYPDPAPGTYSDIYIDHALRNLVLRLRQTGSSRFWKTVGSY